MQELFDLLAIVAFEKHIHPELLCKGVKLCHFMLFEEIGHEQNRIGSEGSCFVNLIFIKDKVLAQNGLCAARLYFAQPLDAHPEMRGVGED